MNYSKQNIFFVIFELDLERNESFLCFTSWDNKGKADIIADILPAP